MTSVLFLTPVDRLQGSLVNVLKKLESTPGVYVSLNKTQKSTELFLKEKGIDTAKLFFIDCVTADKTRDDVLHVGPADLVLLADAIACFAREIKGDKFLIIDALSTLLIYNDENKVAQFVQRVTELASMNDVALFAFSPTTKGEELLSKIFNFFDEVEGR
jgi:archaellum biogenesis ATPase FlaH